MSTISTDDQDSRCLFAKDRLGYIQGVIVTHCAAIQELKNDIACLRNQEPSTQKEALEQRDTISFKERQINELQKSVNVSERKAQYFARALGIIS